MYKGVFGAFQLQGHCGNVNLTINAGCMITKDVIGMELMVFEVNRVRLKALPPLVGHCGK